MSWQNLYSYCYIQFLMDSLQPNYLPDQALSKSPLVEVVAEIRFESAVPPDAIFGMFFQHLVPNFPKIEKLPNGFYRFLSANDASALKIQVGNGVLSLMQGETYTNWQTFVTELKKLLETSKKLRLIKSMKRFGLRYINFFPNMDIFTKSLLIPVYENAKLDAKASIRTEAEIEIADNIYKRSINITNNSVKSAPNPEPHPDKPMRDLKGGSAVDIDVALESMLDISQDIEAKINNCHRLAYQAFFGVLHEDFIKSLE